MKAAQVLLLVLIAWLQFQLWFADGGVTDLRVLNRQISQTQSSLDDIQDENKATLRDIAAIRTSHSSIETLARHDHNMIKPDEEYIQFVPQPTESSDLGL